MTYSPKKLRDVLYILKEASIRSIDDILNVKEDQRGAHTGPDGHFKGNSLANHTESIIMQNLRNCYQVIYPDFEKDISIVFEDQKFEYDFKKENNKPVIVIDLDGQKYTSRHQALRTTLEKQLHRQDMNIFYLKPDAAVCMTMFEDSKFDDVSLSVTTTLNKDQLSAFKYPETEYIMFINNILCEPRNFSEKYFDLKHAQINIMGNTNRNLYGIGEIGELLSRNRKYGEIRIESCGSTAVDIVNLIAGKTDAIVDARGIFKDSWAALQLADFASSYLLLKSLDFYVTDIYGNDIDKLLSNGDEILSNKKLTIIVSRTKELGESIQKDLESRLPALIKDWEDKLQFKDMVSPQNYLIEKYDQRTPFKYSYFGIDDRNNEPVYVHVISPTSKAKEWMLKKGFDLESYIKSELATLLLPVPHDHIVHMLDYGVQEDSLFIVEKRYDQPLINLYPPSTKCNHLDKFYDHLEDILKGLSYVHQLKVNGQSRPIIHGDIKIENFGFLDDKIKLDDWGICSYVKFIGVHEEEGASAFGTIQTRAPELKNEKTKKTIKSDVYSLGNLFVRMWSGYYLLPKKISLKPGLEEPGREEYEKEIIKFRNNPSEVDIRLNELLIDMPYDLKKVIKKMTRKNPNDRYENANEALVAFKKVNQMHNVYHFVVEQTNLISPGDYREKHLADTERWLVARNSKVSYAQKIAARMHDYSGINIGGNLEYYPRYKKKEAEKCSIEVKNLIKGKFSGIDKIFLNRISDLIFYHEHKNLPLDIRNSIGGGIGRIRDADSISFFVTSYDSFVNGMSKEKDKNDRLKTVIKYMWEKMSDEARDCVRWEQKIAYKKFDKYLINNSNKI
jgi:serine/threonine protein kinase